MKTKLSIQRVVNLREWQKIQDSFSAVTETGLRTVDCEGNDITLPSGQPTVCANLFKNSPVIKSRLCGSCLPTFLGGKGVVDKELKSVCENGLSNFIIPLKISPKTIVSYLILGPVFLVSRQSKETYVHAAEELGVDIDVLWSLLLEIRVISLKSARELVELLREVFEHIVKTAYRVEARAAASAELKENKQEQMHRLFNALFDVACQVSGADKGSIMDINKNRILTIRAAKGISREITEQTRIKLGEGLSGLAAQEKMPLLVDNKTADNRIRPYLNRPDETKCSMILPINVRNKTV
ncbi:MAG: PocR ligand-binding domain-containing protein, partial [Candidatus Omnitrophica bacterium]|nr:PocR ligand-binding domain-containing protein [Candidatus Omnitrophota bacterium]